ncbi:MAG: bifunctional biotin--[acetyl-CoA-carboxylase] synthetase/biotin operon repressor [Thermoleophilia bacterium]|nr:bifunctional biotin--[acetyl-CoA-carboxylase] synthetase/biotin operon repressor [Thermoleophilia bacterium]MCZ4496451.1 bifunctional biotin--[acetyl-CoA-carboxylase] synthetase/biotin operon repressor [Thermoleophilia bacterium]
MTDSVFVDVLDRCDSTQAEVHRRLDAAPAGRDAIAVSANHQSAGQGREGRSWVEPADGPALLVSIGVPGPLPISILQDLPRHVGGVVRRELCAAAPVSIERLGWKEPNDLIDEASGAKVGGIVVDARTNGDVVDRLVVGIGANVGGLPFRTEDGRQATSLVAMSWGEPEIDLGAVRIAVAARVVQLLREGPVDQASRATVTA